MAKQHVKGGGRKNKDKKKKVETVIPKPKRLSKKETKLAQLKRKEERIKQERKQNRLLAIKEKIKQDEEDHTHDDISESDDYQEDDEQVEFEMDVVQSDEEYDESEQEDDEEEEEEEKQEPIFQGKLDSNGIRQGDGIYITGDGDIYEGKWNDGDINGPGKLTIGDVIIEGIFVDWEMNGQCKEISKLTNEKIFEGMYVKNERHGSGNLYLVDGGRIKGTWKHDQLTGDCTYYYPDGKFYIKGQWKDGEFVSGLAGTLLKGVQVDKSMIDIKRDESTSTVISKHPLRQDPFENYYLYVAPSAITGANEGLFARRPIPANRLVSFYNGLRIEPHVADARDWTYNSNTMFLDSQTYIVIPPELAPITQYAASLGHKANHSFTHNTVYKTCYHPRFGDIKCVTSVRDIQPDEEILVHYDYEEKDKPDWYKQLEKDHLDKGGNIHLSIDLLKNTNNNTNNTNIKNKNKTTKTK